MRKARARSSGFTVIELVVVFTVMGLIASIALPVYERLLFRSRQAERAIVLDATWMAVEDYHARQARLPRDDGGGASTLTLLPNPSAVLTQQKRPFRTTSAPGDHWGDLALSFDGGVYYVYWGTGTADQGTRDYWLTADGDLDGDGIASTLSREFRYQGPQLVVPGGSSNPRCTAEIELPPGGVTF